MQAERWLVNLIPNSETMSPSGKQSDIRKRWVVKLLKIHAQKNVELIIQFRVTFLIVISILSGVACSAGVFWAGESCLFMLVLLKPPSLML